MFSIGRLGKFQMPHNQHKAQNQSRSSNAPSIDAFVEEGKLKDIGPDNLSRRSKRALHT